jgi:hypothetical protein
MGKIGGDPTKGVRPMRRPSPSLLAFACATAFAGQAAAATLDHTELTLYRSDDSSLFSADNNGSVSSGYAVAREPRALDLKSGVQDVSLSGLPQFLDTEGLSLSIDGGAKVISQRLILGQGQDAIAGSLVGKDISVLGPDGKPMISGTLISANNGLLIKGPQGTALIRNYAGILGNGDMTPGSVLQVRVQSERAGKADAVLSYPTSGLGWRASYIGTLQPGGSCKMRFESRASIANRSGRDWNGLKLTLIAGEPNLNKPSAPRAYMMAKAAPAPMASMDAMPEQATLADYRSYTLPGNIDLPDGSVTQSSLYATRTIDCEQTTLYESGNRGWHPPQPYISPDLMSDGGNVISTVQIKAFDSLPAGFLRVLTADRSGTPQVIGEGRINDTAKGQDATITLGQAFDLTAKRERTAFKVDQAARTMDESFKIDLSNAGDSARTITVREHPSRWREWTLTSSSVKPSKQSPDTLDFRVEVPAHGKATLEYSVRYQWAADVKPQ